MVSYFEGDFPPPDPKLTMEVLPQVRQLAERSIDQAEQAFSTFIAIGQPISFDGTWTDDRYGQTDAGQYLGKSQVLINPARKLM